MDAVAVLEDGRYALIEVKLGSDQYDEAEEHLRKLKSLIEASNEKARNENELDKIMELPSALIILTGSKIGMTRKSGVHVVPIGCLKP